MTGHVAARIVLTLGILVQQHLHPNIGLRDCHNDCVLCMQGSEALFAKECAPNPCCSRAIGNSSAPAPTFNDFKRLCCKWQHAVLGAIRIALASKEYVQIRNALLFLNYNTKVSLSSAILRSHSPLITDVTNMILSLPPNKSALQNGRIAC